MKVILAKTAEDREKLIKVFGHLPIEVERTPQARLRIVWDALTQLRRERLTRHVSEKYKMPADAAKARCIKGVTLPAASVVEI